MARLGKILLVAGLAVLSTTCRDKDDPAPGRTFRMGFQASAPRYDDFDLLVKTIRMWAEPGDADHLGLALETNLIRAASPATIYNGVKKAMKQSAYILKQSEMLNEAKAIGLFSLTFTDIDLTALPDGVDPSIQYFAYLGVVDKDLNAKPAFESWKKIFANKFNP